MREDDDKTSLASLPFGSVRANAPKSKNAKVTLVYQHEPPNVPGKSIKGVHSSNTARAATRFVTRMPNPPSSTRPCLREATRSQANDGPVTTYKARQSLSDLPGDRHGVSANASKTKPAKLRDVSDEKTNAHGPLVNAGCSRCDQDRSKWASAMNTARLH